MVEIVPPKNLEFGGNCGYQSLILSPLIVAISPTVDALRDGGKSIHLSVGQGDE